MSVSESGSASDEVSRFQGFKVKSKSKVKGNYPTFANRGRMWATRELMKKPRMTPGHWNAESG
jgi:hypothetical protein